MIHLIGPKTLEPFESPQPASTTGYKKTSSVTGKTAMEKAKPTSSKSRLDSSKTGEWEEKGGGLGRTSNAPKFAVPTGGLLSKMGKNVGLSFHFLENI
jgi:hypothetical protein